MSEHIVHEVLPEFYVHETTKVSRFMKKVSVKPFNELLRIYRGFSNFPKEHLDEVFILNDYFLVDRSKWPDDNWKTFPGKINVVYWLKEKGADDIYWKCESDDGIISFSDDSYKSDNWTVKEKFDDLLRDFIKGLKWRRMMSSCSCGEYPYYNWAEGVTDSMLQEEDISPVGYGCKCIVFDNFVLDDEEMYFRWLEAKGLEFPWKRK